MFSCIYEGHVRHRRLKPVDHRFRYGLYLLYLDLEELPSLLEGGLGLSRTRFSPASFCRRDHLGDPATPLAEAVRSLVKERTGREPTGPIRRGRDTSPGSAHFQFRQSPQFFPPSTTRETV